VTTAHVDATVDDGGRHVRFAVTGEVDLSNAAAVQETLLRAISNEATTVSVDLGAVEYLDSAGLRLLYALAGRLDTLQIALELVVPLDSPARRVVELAGLAAVARLTPEAAPPYS
jgi:anti-anti-sigma factor